MINQQITNSGLIMYELGGLKMLEEAIYSIPNMRVIPSHRYSILSNCGHFCHYRHYGCCKCTKNPVNNLCRLCMLQVDHD